MACVSKQPWHTFAMFSTLMLAGDTVVMVFVKPLMSVSAFPVSNGLQACMHTSGMPCCLYRVILSLACIWYDAEDNLLAAALAELGEICRV